MNLSVRRTDPQTSVDAAESVQDKLLQAQTDVLWALKQQPEGATDRQLKEFFDWAVESHLVLKQSESGLRTRRKELVDKGLVEDTGKRETLDSGRKSIVWKVCDGN